MKKADLTEGGFYAVAIADVPRDAAGGYGTIEIKRESRRSVEIGRQAHPARLVSIGRWRWQQQGACAAEPVNDGHTTNALIEVVDAAATMKRKVPRDSWDRPDWSNTPARPGMPGGTPLHYKRVVWVRTIVPLGQLLMPWDDFLRRHDEWLFATAEVNAAWERRRKLLDEVLARFTAAPTLEGLTFKWSSQRYSDGLEIMFDGRGPTFADLATDAEIAELAKLDSIINCQLRL